MKTLIFHLSCTGYVFSWLFSIHFHIVTRTLNSFIKFFPRWMYSDGVIVRFLMSLVIKKITAMSDTNRDLSL